MQLPLFGLDWDIKCIYATIFSPLFVFGLYGAFKYLNTHTLCAVSVVLWLFLVSAISSSLVAIISQRSLWPTDTGRNADTLKAQTQLLTVLTKNTRHVHSSGLGLPDR